MGKRQFCHKGTVDLEEHSPLGQGVFHVQGSLQQSSLLNDLHRLHPASLDVLHGVDHLPEADLSDRPDDLKVEYISGGVMTGD